MNKKIVLVLFLVVFGTFGFSSEVFSSANNWWGKGYKTEKWVLSHSGSVLEYSISGAKDTEQYKAMMFHNGKYVEVEFGKSAKFDDWYYKKGGTYTVNFYKCKDSCRPHKYDNKEKIRSSDKKVASITVVPRPGEKTVIVFNAKNNSVSAKSGNALNLNYVAEKPKPAVDPFVEQKEIAKENEGMQDPIFNSKEKQYHFMQLALNQEEIKVENIDDYVEMGLLPKSFGSEEKTESTTTERK